MDVMGNPPKIHTIDELDEEHEDSRPHSVRTQLNEQSEHNIMHAGDTIMIENVDSSENTSVKVHYLPNSNQNLKRRSAQFSENEKVSLL